MTAFPPRCGSKPARVPSVSSMEEARVNKKVFETLNQPFVLWFLTSIVLGFISWQYTEIQKNSAAQQAQERVLKRANLELKLLLKDIQFGAEQGDNLTVGHLNGTLVKLQYNASNPENLFYYPTLQNIMLEIDSRSGTRGLEKFQDSVYEHLKVISNILTRVLTRFSQPNQQVWALLTPDEKASLDRLSKLSEQILTYYAGEANNGRQ